MPVSKVKYEIARDHPDLMDNCVQYADDYQGSMKNEKTFWRNVILSSLLLGIYFTLSIGLTFYQKWYNSKYHYPFGVVFCHLLIKFWLSAIIKHFQKCKKPLHQPLRLTWHNIISMIAAPGVASGLDISFSNWAISLITVSLYTMTKSTAIIFILGFSLILKLEKKSWSLVGVVAMISSGLLMFTYKSTQFDLFGFILCLVASFLSGIRWTLAQLIMQKSKLGLNSPIDMMYYMQPWMLVAVTPLTIWLEGNKLYTDLGQVNWSQSGLVMSTIFSTLGGAILAFNLEVIEFMVVTHTSSLTLSISSIFKELCIVILAVEFEGDIMSGLNFIGLLVCLGGITLHVMQKIFFQKQEIAENVELMSKLSNTNASIFEDHIETNMPLLTEKSTSLMNLIHPNFSTDDEDDFESKDNNSDVLFDILKRRE